MQVNTRMKNATEEGEEPGSQALSRRLFLGGSLGALVGAMVPAAISAGQLGNILRSDLSQKPLDPSRKVRIGIVGGGFGATFQWHLDPNCIVEAVSDHREYRRKHLQQVYGCDKAYPSLEELIKDRAVEAVAIFTGAPDHVRHTELAMDAGKHVIAAVPACTSLEQAERLKEVVERTGLTYMMAETSWYMPEAIAARELYEAGAFGELFYTELEYNHPISERERQQHWYYDGKRTWRYGYAPMLYPTHATSFLTSTTGEEFRDVYCLGILAPEIEGYGIGENAYDNPYNAMMGLFSTSGGNISRANVIWTGTNHGERAQWFGTKLSLYMPNRTSMQPLHAQRPEGSASIVLPAYEKRLPEPMRVETGHGGSHTFLTHEFIAALVEERKPTIALGESLALTVPGIIAFESARRGGKRLNIPSYL
jgi:predicted dehydrogenase